MRTIAAISRHVCTNSMIITPFIINKMIIISGSSISMAHNITEDIYEFPDSNVDDYNKWMMTNQIYPPFNEYIYGSVRVSCTSDLPEYTPIYSYIYTIKQAYQPLIDLNDCGFVCPLQAYVKNEQAVNHDKDSSDSLLPDTIVLKDLIARQIV